MPFFEYRSVIYLLIEKSVSVISFSRTFPSSSILVFLVYLCDFLTYIYKVRYLICFINPKYLPANKKKADYIFLRDLINLDGPIFLYLGFWNQYKFVPFMFVFLVI